MFAPQAQPQPNYYYQQQQPGAMYVQQQPQPEPMMYNPQGCPPPQQPHQGGWMGQPQQGLPPPPGHPSPYQQQHPNIIMGAAPGGAPHLAGGSSLLISFRGAGTTGATQSQGGGGGCDCCGGGGGTKVNAANSEGYYCTTNARWTVVIDDIPRGEIGQGQQLNIPLPPGPHGIDFKKIGEFKRGWGMNEAVRDAVGHKPPPKAHRIVPAGGAAFLEIAAAKASSLNMGNNDRNCYIVVIS